jgi:hypothetical protein
LHLTRVKRQDFNEQSPTTVLPYNDYHGAIIAANSQLYFYPAIIKASNLDDSRNLPRHISEHLRYVDVKAVCMFNNHSLVTVQKASLGMAGRVELHYRLVEYPMQFGEVHVIGVPNEISKLGSMHFDSHTRVTAVQVGEKIIVVVFSGSGQIEMITFVPAADSNWPASPGNERIADIRKI